MRLSAAQKSTPAFSVWLLKNAHVSEDAAALPVFFGTSAFTLFLTVGFFAFICTLRFETNISTQRKEVKL